MTRAASTTEPAIRFNVPVYAVATNPMTTRTSQIIRVIIAFLMAALLMPTTVLAANKSGTIEVCDKAGEDGRLCGRRERETQRKAFDLPPISVFRRHRGEAVRLLQSNENYRPGFAIIAYQDLNMTPRIEFRLPIGVPGTLWRAPLVARLTEAEWRQIMEKRRLLETLHPVDDNSICLDGHTNVAEAIDKEGTVQTRVERRCGDGPIARFTTFLTELAFSKFRYCHALAPDWGGDEATRGLMRCSTLEGDRVLAAELLKYLMDADFDCCLNEDKWPEITHLFSKNVVFSWPGEPTVRDAEAAARIWLASDGTYAETYVGESMGRVRIEARATIREIEAQDVTEQISVPVTSEWVRGADGKFQMVSFDYVAEQAFSRKSRTITLPPPLEMPAAAPPASSGN